MGLVPSQPLGQADAIAVCSSCIEQLAEHAGATQSLKLPQHLQGAPNFCASLQSLYHLHQQHMITLKPPRKAPVLVSGL